MIEHSETIILPSRRLGIIALAASYASSAGMGEVTATEPDRLRRIEKAAQQSIRPRAQTDRTRVAASWILNVWLNPLRDALARPQHG